MLKRELNIILSAFLFFTRVRLPFKIDYKKENQQLILTWFPLIGIFIGGIGGLCYYLLAFVLPQLVCIILSLGAMILITGALHEDGWGDVCDAFGGGYNKEQILNIMKDSRVGAYATIGLIFLFAIKIAALNSVLESKIPMLFIAAHALSRWPVLLITKFWENSRQTGGSKSRDSSSPLSWLRILLALVIALLPLLLFPWIVFSILPVVIVATLLAGKYFQKHIGGYTGDCLGMAQQINEVLIFLFFCFLSFKGILI
ncbi:MAG: adenosylcobinamide-GDP ribazoletransferase [Draconibacterium sp.]|nr:MAG: adenosylcobinamide-GDP ribazoletransferase [Draconibacterium sp.]PIF06576.1 MAG: adenosylcobinamide-GDP ribazoletransferase [Draconibacterium sp.]